MKSREAHNNRNNPGRFQTDLFDSVQSRSIATS